MIYPWQEETWTTIYRLYQAKTLAHALLFTGPNGIGKKYFAVKLAKLILCTEHNLHETFCKTCHLIENKVHPNFYVIDEKATIKIDEIREAIYFANHSSFEKNLKIIFIPNLERINVNAANALLKTLEEPAADTLFLLTSDEWGRLPATLFSRCQKIQFPLPEKKMAIKWLKSQLPQNNDVDQLLSIARGSPLNALQLIHKDQLTFRNHIYEMMDDLQLKKINPLTAAFNLKDKEANMVIHYIIEWILDKLRSNMHFSSLVPLVNYINLLQQFRNKLNAGINLNKQLMFEKIILTAYKGF